MSEQTVTDLDRNELNQVEAMANELDSSPENDSDIVTNSSDNGELKKALSVCLLGGFSILAPNWAVTSDECNALAECYSGVIDKYFPDAANSFGVEASALMLTAGVIGSRIMAGVPRKQDVKKELEHKGVDSEPTIKES